MLEFIGFCVVTQSNDSFAFQVRQPFVITVGECFPNDSFHDCAHSFFVEFLKCVVVLSSINKFDVDWNEAFPYQQKIIDYAADATVPVNKGVSVLKDKMQFCYTFYDIFVTCRVVFNKHISKSLNNFFWGWSDVASDTDILVIITKSSRNIISNVRNEHAVK